MTVPLFEANPRVDFVFEKDLTYNLVPCMGIV